MEPRKRIYQASRRGEAGRVHGLQKLLINSRSARFLAVRRVTQDNCGKKTAGVDGVKSFDSLPHEGIIAAVERRVSDPWILRLIRRWLTAGVLEGGVVQATVTGSPQGGPLSPLLMNAYLHALDVEWESKMRGAKLIRYCDHMVILCRGNPHPWMEKLERIIRGLKLSLNAEKTRVVDAATGFDFLGMHFRLKPMRSNPKRQFCYRWPSTKAMQTAILGLG